uniref:G-protein coupled receptors family 1 profile domain-containing protein n=1 Tax=Mastacembelus armatus TaxID=205130 RepID=A0A3Q3NC54_9TELE
MSLLQPNINITAGVKYQTLHEAILLGVLSMGSSCSFLYINCVLLFTLRSKPVFCETSRYVLLYNLFFADTVQMAFNILLYILASLRIKMTYYACGTVVLLLVFTATVSPLTLAVMSVERYVAVCYPLRHATIFNMRRTGTAIVLVWTISFIHILIRVFMLLYLFTQIDLNLNMNDFCSKEAFFFAPIFKYFEEAYVSIVFLSTGVAIISSYFGVALVARSASTDKCSARKALQTLMLHFIHLSLILTSSLFSTIITAAARTVLKLDLVRIYTVCFVCLIILPRCLGALIYGFRDQTIRPVLVLNLFCQRRHSVFKSK